MVIRDALISGPERQQTQFVQMGADQLKAERSPLAVETPTHRERRRTR